MSICNLTEVFGSDRLSPQEAADFIGVSRRTIDRWRKAGRGPKSTIVKTGAQWRVWYKIEALRPFVKPDLNPTDT